MWNVVCQEHTLYCLNMTTSHIDIIDPEGPLEFFGFQYLPFRIDPLELNLTSINLLLNIYLSKSYFQW